ncbi:MAG: murein L,D-transpeptidase catalytic domain family protein [Gammaproteobacteria bacterium]|nr:MAG: murein L,D-transpeptidase catalytic domain family protein [Gammaproteobacteria bacterium]
MIFKKITSLLLLASGLFAMTVNASPVSLDASMQSELQQLSERAPGLNPKALQLGLEAYNKAQEEGLDNQHILTIIDYTKPSTARRLWVLDLNKDSVLLNTYVAHGQNSGYNYANSFSDRPGSLESSLGVFLTESTYQGKHGYSLKLKGLEKGFNDRAEARDIVVHRADYATAQFAQQHGRLGRSWGCFAVSPAVADSLIYTIKNGTLVFAYYPDPTWLSKSHFLS